MKVDRFDFVLPEDLVAQEPVSPRDRSRLMHVKNGDIKDHHFRDLPSLLQPGDLLVLNDTKVIPARLRGKRGTASVEVTLHQHVVGNTWRTFAKPARKLKVGDRFHIAEDFYADVAERSDHDGQVTLTFNVGEEAFHTLLATHGSMPLPPYIRRGKARVEDKHNYQTIFAREKGAVAAPTAGLHFTDEIFLALKKREIAHCFVTLHVGAGTFLPVKVADTKDHVMHAEYYHISDTTTQQIRTAKQEGRRIVAVGTTSLRTLESVSDTEGNINAGTGETRLFITPGYRWKMVDALITNFHLPRSTLFMLVCAFAGEEAMHRAYKHAIEQRYRFYSYGDACLLERAV